LTLLVATVVLLAAAYLAWRARFGSPPRRWPQVLCFHKISSRFCWEGTWTTPGIFFACIDTLRDSGYRFVGLEEYLESANPACGGEPRESDAAGTLLLTFDDGYRELYDVVLPGLEERGVPLHVFVVTDYVGRNNDWDLSLGRRPFPHLGWPEIEDMARRGVTFGSHGASHGDFTAMGEVEIREELDRSKSVLESRLGRPVRSVSWPFGRCDERAKNAAREAGYDAAFSLYPPHHNTVFDPFAIRRNGVYIIDRPGWIRIKLTGGPVFWLEEMKCRAINAVAALTPALKRLSVPPARRDN
jgi:peptidoglycan/xylan/chitin deacetylase (PgdA/CDA1 family)